jgi:hypothetical protein
MSGQLAKPLMPHCHLALDILLITGTDEKPVFFYSAS